MPCIGERSSFFRDSFQRITVQPRKFNVNDLASETTPHAKTVTGTFLRFNLEDTEMKRMMWNRKGMTAVIGICLLGAAAVLAQRRTAPPPVTAANVRELSAVFRQVARNTTPSIVTIMTQRRAVQSQAMALPFDDKGPLGELFKNDPRLREFRKRRPQRHSPLVRGEGSGFVIDPSGIIVTNRHVVRDADVVTVRLTDGREFTATDVKTDPRSDIAIVRIKAPKDLKPIPLGDSEAMQVGDWVLAVGSPFRFETSVTAGIISAKGRGLRINDRENYLQTDAAINPGNSGGPLLNLNGEVIGINTAISTRSGGYDGIGFAIPINMAKWVIHQLIDKGHVSRAYLGVAIQPIDSKLSKSFHTPVGQGALVGEVMPNSPAANAKVQPGDIILSFAGHPVSGPLVLQGIVERLTVGQSYKMELLRDGKRMTLSVTLREMPRDYSVLAHKGGTHPSPDSADKSQKFSDLGIEIQDFTPEIAKQLGYPKAGIKGVLVASVSNGSPAEAAGLRAGMVISRVGSKAVTSPQEFRNALKGTSLTNGVALLVRTPQGSRFVVIQAPATTPRSKK